MAKFPLKFTNTLLNSYEIRHQNRIWTVSSAVKPSPWLSLVPDEVAIDGSQTGLAISYRVPLFSLPSNPQWYVEGGITPFHLVRPRSDRYHFSSAGFRIRHANKNPVFSSWGFGFRGFQNWHNHRELDNNLGIGGTLDFGVLADKLRITIGYRHVRSGFDDERWLMQLGVCDIKGIFQFAFSD